MENGGFAEARTRCSRTAEDFVAQEPRACFCRLGKPRSALWGPARPPDLTASLYTACTSAKERNPLQGMLQPQRKRDCTPHAVAPKKKKGRHTACASPKEHLFVQRMRHSQQETHCTQHAPAPERNIFFSLGLVPAVYTENLLCPKETSLGLVHAVYILFSFGAGAWCVHKTCGT